MTYLFFKSLHVIAVIAWMVGLLYLPRLFVYHVDAKPGSEMSETFKVMERRLLKIIMTPAMLASWVIGLWLAFGERAVDMSADFWFHAKLTLVVVLSGFHMALAKWRKEFEADQNTRSARFYRFMNEVPTLLMIAIVLLVIMKPF
ncbi:MAG: protoporphyrinogen oxidase HemJ [Hyphomicrobiaceae bacterium]|nr:protoporphyrinogen oxidase HemJ [Hyphomicrobiaceae bacterium]